jgi:hypothetical protein
MVKYIEARYLGKTEFLYFTHGKVYPILRYFGDSDGIGTCSIVDNEMGNYVYHPREFLIYGDLNDIIDNPYPSISEYAPDIAEYTWEEWLESFSVHDIEELKAYQEKWGSPFNGGLNMDFVEKALTIATVAHASQKDKAGVDYIEHPKTVASFVDTPEEKAVAYLHDVIEDTEVTADDLREEGIPDVVVDAVVVLTHPKQQLYFEYLKTVKKNKLAKTVKLADLRHNSDLSRINRKLTETDYKRLEKYKLAKEFLES